MNGDGKIEYLTVETLLNKSGIQFDPYHPEEWEKALSVLTKFQNMKMIETLKSGDVFIKNWEKRQEHNLTVAERVAKSRAKRKDVTNDVTDVTSEENRIEENRIEKSKDIYGEHKNVKLSSEEYLKLKERLGEVNTILLIEELSAYIASKGKRYSSHYATIQTWARRRVTEHNENLSNKKERYIA